jgi:hypothetical protein
MGVRIEQAFVALRKNRYRVRIIDTEYSGSVGTFNSQPEGVIFKTNGDRKDIFNPINLASCTLNFYLDNEDVWNFWEDLIAAEESRFYLQVDRYLAGENGQNPWRREFIGVILIDSLKRQDHTWPAVSIEAVDGLSVLKGVEYEFDTNSFLQPLWKIFYDAIKKNKVIDTIYGSSDVIMEMYSNLSVNSGAYANNGNDIFSTVNHVYYMFDREGNAVTPWNCYRVIEEMCRKYMLRLIYDNGKYIIKGVETYFNPSDIATKIKITKAGSKSSANGSELEPIEVNGLAGGNYTYENGHRQVRIVSSKEGSNKYLAENIVYTLDTSSITLFPNYAPIPPMAKNIRYDLHIRMSTFMRGLYVRYFEDNKIQHCLKIRFKFTNLETNGVKYGKISPNNWIHSPDTVIPMTVVDDQVENKIYIGKYILGSYTTLLKFEIPEVSFDRKVEWSFEWEFHKDFSFFDVGTNVSEYDYTMYLTMGTNPLGETGTAIPINAYIADSKNTETYEVKLYSSDMYGGDGTLAWMIDAQTGLSRPSDLGWRFTNSGTYEGLEKAMSKFMISQLSNNQEILTLPVTVDEEISSLTIPRAFGNIIYKDKEYSVLQIEENYLDSVSIVHAVRKTSATTKTITSNAIKRRYTEAEERNNTITDVFLIKNKTEAYVFDIQVVNSQTLLLPSAIFYPDDEPWPTFESMVGSFAVYVDGVLWNLVDGVLNDPSVPPNPKRPRWSMIRPTKEILFSRILTNSWIKIVWSDRYVYET